VHSGIKKIIISLIFFILFIWASGSLIYNLKNVDRDGDNLIDYDESIIGSDSFDIDSDDDGIDDYSEYHYWQGRSKEDISPYFFDFWYNYWNETFNKIVTYEIIRECLQPIGDIDNDNLSNILDPDSDNDGIFDNKELLMETDPALPNSASSSGKTDSDIDSGGAKSGGGGSGVSYGIFTKTNILNISSYDLYKSGKFVIEGNVVDINDNGIYNITVRIYVNKTKDTKGIFAGSGLTNLDGVFNITCNVPDDSEIGSNHILAHSMGNKIYASSWSDPEVNISSDTKINFDMLDSVGMNSTFEIKGYLLDLGDKPLFNKTVKIFWNDARIAEDKNITTNENGKFRLLCIYNSIGEHEVTVTFDGDEFLNSSSASKTISVKDMGTIINLNLSKNKLKREDTLNLGGNLTDSNFSPLSNNEIIIFYNDENINTLITSAEGLFEDTITIPVDSPIGNVSVKAFFSGNSSYGDAEGEEIIIVESDTILIFNNLDKDQYGRNETINISGILTDNYNNPLSNMTVTLMVNIYSMNFFTDEDGSFNFSYLIPLDVPLGIYDVIGKFYQTDYYLGSQDSISFEIISTAVNVQKGEANNNILIIIIVALSIAGIGGVILTLLKKENPNEKSLNLYEIANQTINQLRTENDFRKAVLICYNDMCKWLDASGLKKNQGQTPREFAYDIKDVLNVSDECLISLTEIFEKACYSAHDINIQEREKTIACLIEIVSSLNNANLSPQENAEE